MITKSFPLAGRLRFIIYRLIQFFDIMDNNRRFWEYDFSFLLDLNRRIQPVEFYRATEITINDLDYNLTTIDLDSDCDNHPALLRIKEDEDRVYFGILPTLTCTRCGHAWTPRSDKIPDVCPNPQCKSPYWNKPRKVK